MWPGKECSGTKPVAALQRNGAAPSTLSIGKDGAESGWILPKATLPSRLMPSWVISAWPVGGAGSGTMPVSAVQRAAAHWVAPHVATPNAIAPFGSKAFA